MFKARSTRMTLLGLIAPIAFIGATTIKKMEVMPESRIWISGTSTLRSFDCEVPRFDLQVDANGSSAAADLLAGKRSVTTTTLRIAASDMDCRNGTMNEHMLKALKADQNPELRFVLTGYELKGGEGTTDSAAVGGTLTIGGKARDIAFVAKTEGVDGGAVRVRGDYTVKMSDWDLKRPSLMLGSIKVGDDIVVHMDLVLRG